MNLSVEITKEFLISALNKVKPGIAKKAIVEQTSHFMFLDTVLASFSDQIAIVLPFDTGLTFSAKADDFYKMINSIEEDDLEISVDDNNVTIKTENTSAGMPIVMDEKSKVETNIATLLDEMKEGEWVVIPEDFLTGISLSSFSTAKNLSMGVLACISINGADIISTDTIRASWYNMKSKLPSFLIPAMDADEVVSYTDLTEMCLSDNWIHFRAEDGLSFSIKRVIGNYRNIKEVFEVKGETINLPGTLRNTLKAIEFIAEGDVLINKVVQVKIEKGKIICRAQKETGYIEKKIDFPYKGKDISFYINPVFLYQVLEKSTKMIFGGDRVLFENENFKHFYMLPEGKE